MRQNVKKVYLLRAICLAVAFTILSTVLYGCGGKDVYVDEQYALIRIHIRANSNSDSDQQIKLSVRDKVSAYLERELGGVDDFETAYKMLESMLFDIQQIANKTLIGGGFGYTARAKLCEEFFPTRSYENLVVQSGYYDALIIELGEAKGDNWWCVIYPPLCYLEAKQADGVVYKSYIKELIDKYFG